jgi:hypothetical protein
MSLSLQLGGVGLSVVTALATFPGMKQVVVLCCMLWLVLSKVSAPPGGFLFQLKQLCPTCPDSAGRFLAQATHIRWRGCLHPHIVDTSKAAGAAIETGQHFSRCSGKAGWQDELPASWSFCQQFVTEAPEQLLCCWPVFVVGAGQSSGVENLLFVLCPL